MNNKLRAIDMAVLRSLQDVWDLASEVRLAVWLNYPEAAWSDAEIVGALRRLRNLGLADYRSGFDFPMGEWAITEAGDEAAGGAKA